MRYFILELDHNIEIIEINNLFRGLIIPSGENVFTMEFKPDDILLSKYLTNIIYILLLLSFIVIIYKRKNV